MVKANQSQKSVREPIVVRVGLSFIVPIVGAFLLSFLAGGFSTANGQGQAPFFAGLGVSSWLLGMRWYGVKEMGFRGKRPLFSSIGFATLGWVTFLASRFYFVDIAELVPGSGSTFMYMLLFEAFALQIWTFGLLFRVLAEWRGGLTAAISSGVVFGAVGFLMFQEAYSNSFTALLSFATWGIFYGVIRLRSGSLLGIVIIQAMQSFTGWLVITPFPEPIPTQLNPFYLATAAAYLLFIWRLWPKVAEDYRV